MFKKKKKKKKKKKLPLLGFEPTPLNFNVSSLSEYGGYSLPKIQPLKLDNA
jgi:hypothetical protein